MDRGTEQRASGQSCPGSPAAVSNCCLPAVRLTGISLPVGPCSSLHPLVPPLGGTVPLLSVCLWLSLRPLEHGGVLRGRGRVGLGLGSCGGLTASPLSSLLPLLGPSCQKGVCVCGVYKGPHLVCASSLSLLHFASTQVLLRAVLGWTLPAYLLRGGAEAGRPLEGRGMTVLPEGFPL